jgi:hypothetical protein
VPIKIIMDITVAVPGGRLLALAEVKEYTDLTSEINR